MTQPYPTPGRRRAEHFGNDFPEHAPQTMQALADDAVASSLPRPMLEDVLSYADDRLDRLEHVLGDLNGVVMRAGTQLEPLLTGGTYAEPDYLPEDSVTNPEDRRSTIARRVADKADRTDRLADAVVAIRTRLNAILDALEV